MAPWISLISRMAFVRLWHVLHCQAITTHGGPNPAWRARFSDGSLSNSASHAGLDLFSSDGRSAVWLDVPSSNSLSWRVVQVAQDPMGYPKTVSVSGPGHAITQLACCSTAGLPVLFSLDIQQGNSMGALLWHTEVNLTAFNSPAFSYYESMPMDLLLAVVAATTDKQLEEQILISAFGGFNQVPKFACIAAHNVTRSNSSGGGGGNFSASLLWSACYGMKWSLDGYPLVRLVQLSNSIVGFYYSNSTALHVHIYYAHNGTLLASQAIRLLNGPAEWWRTAQYAAFAVSVPQMVSDARAWSDGLLFAVSFTGTPEVSMWHLNLTSQQVQKVWVQDPTTHEPRCNITSCWHVSNSGQSWTLGANAGINTPMWSNSNGILVHYCTQAVIYALNPQPGCMTGMSATTGAVLWQHPTPALGPVTLSLHNDTAVVVTSGVGWFGWPPTGPSQMVGVDIVAGIEKYRVSPGENAIYGWSTMDGRGHVYVEAQLGSWCAVLAYSSSNGQLVGSTADVPLNTYGNPQLMGAPFQVGMDGGLYSAHSRYGPLIAMYPLPSAGPTASPMPYPSSSPTPSATPAAAATLLGGVIGGAVAGGVLATGVMLGLAWKVWGRLHVQRRMGLAAGMGHGEDDEQRLLLN